MAKNNHDESHTFMCMNCGKASLPLIRKAGQKRQRFHRKKLYCPWCGLECNHIEVSDNVEKEEFLSHFRQGEYLREVQESLEFCKEKYMKILYLMCGPAGSGKSTWIKNHIKEDEILVSRDAVRFEMVSEDEYYFAREEEVFDEYCKRISEGLKSTVGAVYADATHLTEKARNKVLDKIENLSEVKIVPVVVCPKLETILEQNAKRTGRAFVPETVIKNMYKSFTIPNENEKYKYGFIINTEEV